MNVYRSAVLVTGASGFIGSRFRQPEHRGLVRGTKCPSQNAVGDLLDPDSLQRACEGVETVFHCAGYAHTFTSSDPEAHWRINYEGTVNLLNAAVGAGVRKFIFLSSVKAMAEPGGDCVDEGFSGPPVTHYGKAKRAAEDAVLATGLKHGMHVVNLRLAMVYGRGGKGNLERMARAISSGWFPPLPETGNRRSLVHVDDVISAMNLVATRPEANGKTYIVADKQVYSSMQIYQAVRRALKLSESNWQIPEGVIRAGGSLGDLLGRVIGKPLPINTEIISRLLDSACYSPAYICQDLGWSAQVSLEDGLIRMLARTSCQ